MQKLLIGLSVLIVLLFSGCTRYPFDNIFIGMFVFVIYLPMIVIEAFVIRWMFAEFDAEDSVMASFFINFVSIIFYLFITHSKMLETLADDMIDGGFRIILVIGIVLINIFIQLLALKLKYKAVISIKGVSGIVLAHIAIIGVVKWVMSVMFPIQLY